MAAIKSKNATNTKTIQNAKLRCNYVHEKFKNVDEKILEDFLMKMWLTCKIKEIILKKDEGGV